MEVDKETEQKILQLQILEQNLQNFALQRQNFQVQLMEIENALEELNKTKGEAYKLAGNIMVLSNKKDLVKDLNEKKDMFELRVKNLEKQEKKIQEKAEELKNQVMKELEK